MADRRHPRGLIDTSVLIDLEQIEPDALPQDLAVARAYGRVYAEEIVPI